MAEAIEVLLEIWFDGKDNRMSIKLTAADAARFEIEYASWMQSGLLFGEFHYMENEKKVYLRFDAIVMRKVSKYNRPASPASSIQSIKRVPY